MDVTTNSIFWIYRRIRLITEWVTHKIKCSVPHHLYDENFKIKNKCIDGERRMFGIGEFEALEKLNGDTKETH